MNNILAIGIDVGLNGGIAYVKGNRYSGINLCQAIIMPIISSTGKNTRSMIDVLRINEFLKLIKNENTDSKIIIGIETQQAMPKQGVNSMFHLGETYGMIEAILILSGLPFIRINPKTWKKEILAGTNKDKFAAINYVRCRYPDLDLNVGIRKIIYHDGMADAVCIAEYTYRNELNLTGSGRQT